MLQCSLEVAAEPGFLMSWELKRCQSLHRPCLSLLGQWGEPSPPPSVSGLLHHFHSPIPPLSLRDAHAKERGHHADFLPFSSREEDNAVFVPRIQRNYVR